MDEFREDWEPAVEALNEAEPRGKVLKGSKGSNWAVGSSAKV